MAFNPETNPVDYILLANRRSPGIAVVNAATSLRQWDERRAYGLSGSIVVYRGVKLARPIVTFRLLSSTDWDEWHEWSTMLARPTITVSRQAQTESVAIQRPRIQGARPLDIWHPILEDLGIASVVIEEVTQPKQVDDGEWNIDVKFIEYRRPVIALEPAKAPATTPTDPVDVYISDLTSQVQALSAGNS